jgi:hypothetical protein
MAQAVEHLPQLGGSEFSPQYHQKIYTSIGHRVRSRIQICLRTTKLFGLYN